MARIFISYRREDSDMWVSRLVDELRSIFRLNKSSRTSRASIPAPISWRR